MSDKRKKPPKRVSKTAFLGSLALPVTGCERCVDARRRTFDGVFHGRAACWREADFAL